MTGPTGPSWHKWAAGSVSVQRYAIRAGEWVTVDDACVMVCDALPVLVVDGVLRLDGVLKGA